MSVSDFLDLKTLSALQRTSREFRARIMPLMIQWALHLEWEDESWRPTTVRYMVHSVQWNRVYVVKRLLDRNVPAETFRRAFHDSKSLFIHNFSPYQNIRTKAFRLFALYMSEYIDAWDLSSAAEGKPRCIAALKVLLLLASAKLNNPSPSGNYPLMSAVAIAPETKIMELLLKAGANHHCYLPQDSSGCYPEMSAMSCAILSNYAQLQKVRLLESVGVSCETLSSESLRKLLFRWSYNQRDYPIQAYGIGMSQ